MANGVQFSGENKRYCTLLGGGKGSARGSGTGTVKRRAVLGGWLLEMLVGGGNKGGGLYPITKIIQLLEKNTLKIGVDKTRVGKIKWNFMKGIELFYHQNRLRLFVLYPVNIHRRNFLHLVKRMLFQNYHGGFPYRDPY